MQLKKRILAVLAAVAVAAGLGVGTASTASAGTVTKSCTNYADGAKTVHWITISNWWSGGVKYTSVSQTYKIYAYNGVVLSPYDMSARIGTASTTNTWRKVSAFSKTTLRGVWTYQVGAQDIFYVNGVNRGAYTCYVMALTGQTGGAPLGEPHLPSLSDVIIHSQEEYFLYLFL